MVRNKLQEIGFPPYFEGEDAEKESNSSSSSTFVRVSSLDLSGNVTLYIHSKPLDRPIVEDVKFDLKAIAELNSILRRRALIGSGGRKGSTTDEVYEMIEQYFESKIFQLLQHTALDLSKSFLKGDPLNSSDIVQTTKKLVIGARDKLVQYGIGAGTKTWERMWQGIGDCLRKRGIDLGKMVQMLNEVFKVDEDFEDDQEEEGREL
eukprot:scaffold82814_cov52-Attheya_sp.AAC.2